ncbi:MAG: chromate transporter [Blastocatellales bacterium]
MIRLHQLREAITRLSQERQADAGLRSLGWVFLKLGFTGFGGGIAVIAQIRTLVVTERRWLSDDEFLDAVSLAQSLPGANAANAITYIGLRLAGVRGAIVSVVSFILPSFLMMIGLTVVHEQLHHLAAIQNVFQGLNAAVVGLIAATTVRLAKSAIKQEWHLELGMVAAFLLIFTGASIVEVVLLAGVTGILVQSFKTHALLPANRNLETGKHITASAAIIQSHARRRAADIVARREDFAADHHVEFALLEVRNHEPIPDEKLSAETAAGHDTDEAAQASASVSEADERFTKLRSLAWPLLALPLLANFATVWQLVVIFLRAGAVTFGGGFVMIPHLEAEIVNNYHWLTPQAFADGMTFGQITPGPVLITATFIGWKVAGLTGAVAATIAAFLPAFLMTVVAGTWLDHFRTNHQVQAFLAGVAPAVVGMIAAAGVSLARTGLNSTLSYGVAMLAFLLLLRARINPVLIILGCGLLQLVAAHFLSS